MRPSTLFCLCASLFFAVSTAQAKAKPRIIFDDDGTPLQRAINQSVEERKQKEKRDNPACARALEDETPDPKKIAKACKIPGSKSKKLSKAECPDCGELKNKHGKVVGKKVVTETILDYEEPEQRGKSKWEDLSLPTRLSNPLLGRHTEADPDPNIVKLRNDGVFSGSANNEDKDCRDRVTGKRMGGYATLTSASPVADGDAASCFDSSSKLKQTLTVVAGGCEHIESGTTFVGDATDAIADECFDATGMLQTTLEEIADEDPSEAGDDDGDGLSNEDAVGDSNGDGNPNDDHDCISAAGVHERNGLCEDAAGLPLTGVTPLVDEDGATEIDQDADGRFSEDPVLATNDSCTNFGVAEFGLPPGLGTPKGKDGCDLSRALVAIGNKKAAELHGKAFKADENGVCNTTDTEGIPCGGERRRTKLTESFAARCNGRAEFIDGECVTPPEETLASLQRVSFFEEEHSEGDVGSAGLRLASLPSFGTTSRKDRALMGFTFAPPVIEWGYRIDEEACIDLGFTEFCFEIFHARIGYSFDLAVGLRLPVEVTVTDIPSPMVPAEARQSFHTSLEPKDFTAKDYREICQQNHLDQERFIADCERFSFPEYLDSMNPFSSADEKDGKEFVAQAAIFAGIQVRVLSIPVINFGIDASADLPTLCTFLQIYNKNLNFAELGAIALNTKSLLQGLKGSFANCASFTTPWGEEPHPVTGEPRPRIFPLSGSIDIPADCAEALIKGPAVTIKGKRRPICTGMILGMNGASLGIGLSLELTASSTLITADFGVTGDARAGTTGEVEFKHPILGQPQFPTLGPITFDNYDSTTDTGTITLDNFTYFLNRLDLVLNAKLQFGGILSVIPDLASLPVFRLAVDGGHFGIPIGQHAGMEPIAIPVFVENHALNVDASPSTNDALLRVDDNTLRIKPGEFGDFKVQVENRGSVMADMDNFTRTLSNQPNQNSPFIFRINQNTDFDCTGGGTHFRGNPYDGFADDCFAADGTIRVDRTEKINEDPAGPGTGPVFTRDQDTDGFADEDPFDDWRAAPEPAAFSGQQIAGVPAHSMSTQSLTLSVSPFRHPLTAPGLYPILVTGDSQQGRARALAATDPSGEKRVGASDVVFVKVESFFDPQLSIVPATPAAKPGVAHTYSVEGVNGGNVDDSMDLTTTFRNFNQAGCTLTTLGSLPGGAQAGCPYRAVPTQVPAALWTNVATLDTRFGPLVPLGQGHDSFTITVPIDWAGMQDTTYEFVIAAASTTDAALPPATNSRTVRQTVLATKESMTRYIGLEIAELTAEIEKANAQGVSTGGLLPMAIHPLKMMNDQALASILAGNLGGASRAHASSIRIVEAFRRSVSRAPSPYLQDWTARANAILQDLATAEASTVASIR